MPQPNSFCISWHSQNLTLCLNPSTQGWISYTVAREVLACVRMAPSQRPPEGLFLIWERWVSNIEICQPVVVDWLLSSAQVSQFLKLEVSNWTSYMLSSLPVNKCWMLPGTDAPNSLPTIIQTTYVSNPQRHRTAILASTLFVSRHFASSATPICRIQGQNKPGLFSGYKKCSKHFTVSSIKLNWSELKVAIYTAWWREVKLIHSVWPAQLLSEATYQIL